MRREGGKRGEGRREEKMGGVKGWGRRRCTPELKVLEYGSWMGTEISQGELEERTFEVKVMAPLSRPL